LAKDVEVSDYLPCGLEYDQSLNPSWSMSNDIAKTTVSSVDPGMEAVVVLRLKLKSCIDQDAYLNIAEISDAKDGNGFDG